MTDISNIKTEIVTTSPTRRYVVATDGACRGNPGPGGWGAVLLSYDSDTLRGQHELSGAKPSTTNNAMELTAALRALEWLRNQNPAIPITVISDSQYLIKGMTEWRHGWAARQWRTAEGKPVANLDLWTALIDAAEGRDVDWVWVRGHSGHPENERADQLGNAAIDRMLARKRA